MRVAIYARQSQTRDDHESASIKTQLEACQDYAHRQGWTVVDTYTDTNTPADAVGKRHALAKLLADAESELFECVLAYDTTRLWRRVDIGSGLRVKMRELGITHMATLAGVESLDYSSNPEALAMRQMKDVFAELENNMRGAKLRDMKADHARAGKANGGGRRPFGWTDHKRSEVDEDEAELIREAADRIFNKGWSCGRVLRDWYERGIKTPTGNPWQRPTFHRMIKNPALAGKRVHNGKTYKAQWTAILDDVTHAAVVSTLNHRAQDKPGGPGKSALLSGLGILLCGRCSARMRSVTTGSGVKVYRCVKRPGTVNCGKTQINAAELEAHVAEWLTDEIPYSRLAGVETPSKRHAEIVAEIEHYETLRRETVEDREAKLIGRAEYLERLRRYGEKLSGLQVELSEVEAEADSFTEFMYGPAGEDFVVTATSPEVPESQRENFRRALRTFVDVIEVGPAKLGGKIDLERVTITPHAAKA